MKQYKQFGALFDDRFCNFRTGYAGKCGIWPVLGNGWCKYHQNKKEPNPRPPRIKRYSGYSTFQQEVGSWQQSGQA